ncbi:MAG: DEAD/DEAH box helicase [Treponema sp.]|jgi:ATP-dependent RNA helicase RhlB|nr:DEAD/DEAH box helicase [Treponema sp.]
MNFTELNLNTALQKGIAECGYTICTPVQEQVLTQAFTGQDLYVQSQTGTGKTAAFLTVVFQRLLTESLLYGRKALIMAPTRELVVQIEEEAQRIGKYLPFKTGSFFGGVGYGEQQASLKNNVQIMVGTPGRIIDLNQAGVMNLIDVAFLIIDEADRMFDMGFYPDLRKILKVVPLVDKRQTMLFSATLNTYVKNLAWEYTKNPIEIEIQPEIRTVVQVQQLLYHVPSENKLKLLLGVLKRDNPESAVIFCNTKKYTEILARRLSANGYKCEFIIGDLPQPKRLKIIEDIKQRKIRYLTATDVAARGLDIEDLSMVVNYDLPIEAENYVHRIGRTARAGKNGKAITFASEQDVYELADIEKYIEQKIPSEIANEDLYIEDKTATRRSSAQVQHERSDEKAGENKRKRERSRRGSQSERRTRPSAQTVAKQPVAQSGTSTRHSRRSRRSRSHMSLKIDLSTLSFNERMAYYKEKYSSDKSAQKQGGRRHQTGKSAEWDKKANAVQNIPQERRNSRTTARTDGETSRRSQGQRPSITDSQKMHSVSRNSPSTSMPTAHEKIKKQGLIAKIFEFFRRK